MKTKLIIFSLFITVNGFCQVKYKELGEDNLSYFIELKSKGLKQIVTLSEENDKRIFLYFTTKGCAPCMRMQRDVFPDKELIGFLSANFVCVKSMYGKENTEDEKLREKYNINGNPNFIIINSKGEIIHRITRAARGAGYKSKEDLIKFGKEAIDNKNNYAILKKKYEGGDLSYETINTYLQLQTPVAMKVVEGKYDNYTQRILDGYFKTQSEKDYSLTNNWNIINSYVDNATTKEFQYLIKNMTEFYGKYGKGNVDKRIFQVLQWYGFYGSSDRCEKAQKEIKSWNSPHVKAIFEIEEARKFRRKDLNKFAELVNQIYIGYYEAYSNEMNNRAWEIYEASNDENSNIKLETLEIASKWMDLITKLHSENEYYKGTNLKIKQKINKL